MEFVGRRLPIFLLIESSANMSGANGAAVRRGIETLLSALRCDPQCLETAYLSAILYSDTARQITPLNELMFFQSPALEASGQANLGEGFRLLEQCILSEVRRSSPTQKGDYKPLVFLLTAGRPTDLQGPAETVRQLKPSLVVLLAEPGTDPQLWKQLTECVVPADQLTEDHFRNLFKWVSASVKAVSTPVQQAPPSAAPPQAGRRVPVYVVLECSHLMAGEPIQAATRVIKSLLADLAEEPSTREICVAILSFDGGAQLVPLTPLRSYQGPRVKLRSGAAVGAALRLLGQCISREVQAGDGRPVIVLVASGLSSDAWESAAADLRRQVPACTIAVAVTTIDSPMLRQLADLYLHEKDVGAGDFKRIFASLEKQIHPPAFQIVP